MDCGDGEGHTIGVAISGGDCGLAAIAIPWQRKWWWVVHGAGVGVDAMLLLGCDFVHSKSSDEVIIFD